MTKTTQRNTHGQAIHQCKVCGKADISGSLKRHIESKHMEGVSIPCNYCEKTFRSRNSLSMHIRANHKVAKFWGEISLRSVTKMYPTQNAYPSIIFGLHSLRGDFPPQGKCFQKCPFLYEVWVPTSSHHPSFQEQTCLELSCDKGAQQMIWIYVQINMVWQHLLYVPQNLLMHWKLLSLHPKRSFYVLSFD